MVLSLKSFELIKQTFCDGLLKLLQLHMLPVQIWEPLLAQGVGALAWRTRDTECAGVWNWSAHGWRAQVVAHAMWP
jgi:hypothetical protein